MGCRGESGRREVAQVGDIALRRVAGDVARCGASTLLPLLTKVTDPGCALRVGESRATQPLPVDMKFGGLGFCDKGLRGDNSWR